jgi:hypothetical protein
VLTLQTLPACDAQDRPAGAAGQASGFSLHAGVAARADERDKLERLCRTISRPAVSAQRLSLTSNGNVRYQRKTPYRDGTTLRASSSRWISSRGLPRWCPGRESISPATTACSPRTASSGRG